MDDTDVRDLAPGDRIGQDIVYLPGLSGGPQHLCVQLARLLSKHRAQDRHRASVQPVGETMTSWISLPLSMPPDDITTISVYMAADDSIRVDPYKIQSQISSSLQRVDLASRQPFPTEKPVLGTQGPEK